MTLTEWFIFFLIVQIVHFAGTWKLYEAAGRKRWEAAVPVYNAIVLMKIIGRPAWWTILLFIPIVNLIMIPVVWVETIRSFGRNSIADTLLVLFTLGFFIYYINYTQHLEHIPNRSLTPRTKAADTFSSLLFAVIVATLVHTYVMQPFTIPTSSLEKTLLVGDFLFVSKFHYGARTPMTTVAAPMVHDTIPIANIRSYSKWPQLPYFRLPGTSEIRKNDIVVFNWPADTVREFRVLGPRVDKPVDKKSNYVKRCVATPGDSLEIRNGEVFVNGSKLKLHDRARLQYSYLVELDGTAAIDGNYLRKELEITDRTIQMGPTTFLFEAVTDASAERLKNLPGIASVKRLSDMPSNNFGGEEEWTFDNFGPIYIPEEGKTVALNHQTLPFYKKIIEEYEHHDLEVNGNEIRIDGQVATTYTFGQNYYWMMGDNRHNSEDSRAWGYVPADHIVGKPVFIWLSIDRNERGFSKIRWERMFTTVGGDGEPVSYFKFFLILLGAYFAFEWFIKKKKKAEA